MKLVDEKGKLFGFINIIDLVVLLVVVLVAGALGYKLLGDKIGKVTGTQIGTKEVIVTIKCTARDEYSAKALQVGDKLISLTSYQPASVLKVTIAPMMDEVVTADGKKVLAQSPQKKEVTVVTKMQLDTGAAILKLGSQDVAIGTSFRVKTQKVDLPGLVQSIEIK